MKPERSLLALALCGVCLVLAQAAPSGATWRFQEQAKELGYPADDCAYCHSFTHEHMTRHAREAGLRSTNCIHCHGASLPLEGFDLYNDRGRFLLDEKEAREAKRCEMRWLEGYVDEDEAGEDGDDRREPPRP